jgi:hypothetical protein
VTAPIAPPPSRQFVLLVLGLIAFAIAMPFVRRDDWIGWVALLIMAAVAIGSWILLIWGSSGK